VSLRRWSNRASWANGKNKDRRWREVRAYRVDDIETWLEAAPVTHAWLADRLGLEPYGIQAGESWWEGWSGATSPELPWRAPLAGRSSEANELRAQLADEPDLITITGGGREELLAFVVCCAREAAENDEGALLARVALVDDVASWRALIDHDVPLVLLPMTDEVRQEARVKSSRHHIVVPLPNASGADLELPPLDSGEAAKVLEAAGLEEEEAADASRLARRSLVALRRRLARKPELEAPPWASTPVPRQIRGILLAGGWSESFVEDQTVLSELCGMPYEDLREELVVLADLDDPFVLRVGDQWSLVSAYDAYMQLEASLRDDDMERFARAVKTVLLERDPALDLKPHERYMAQPEGKVRAHSGELRAALATTLAILGFRGNSMKLPGSNTGASVVAVLVRGLLAEANRDASGDQWHSIAPLLPLLAEAAPDQFLEAVRDGTQGDNPVLAKLFSDSDSDSSLLGPDSAHPHLLWALETVAWSPDHFGQAVDLLARLNELDPGGRLANRPFRSLTEIFCFWYPDTAAPYQARLEALDGIRRRHPEVGWELLQELLPETHAVHHPTHAPRFRDWQPPRVPIPHDEQLEAALQISEWLIEDARGSADRYKALLERASQLPPERLRELAAAIANEVEDGRFSQVQRSMLWEALRSLVADHREFAEADWSLPETQLVELEDLAAKVQPEDPKSRHGFLFDDWMPQLGDGPRGDDWDAYQVALAERRRQAAAEIEDARGLDGLLDLAATVQIPWAIGAAVAEVTQDKHLERVLELVDADSEAARQFAAAFVATRVQHEGWEWVDRLLERDLTTERRARILIATRPAQRAWETADAQGEKVAIRFWQLFSPLGLGPDFPHVQLVAERLLRVGRPAAALRELSLYVQGRSTQEQSSWALVAADALEALLAANSDDAELRGLAQHDFEALLALLDRHSDLVGHERVAALEWAYLPALGFRAKAPNLHRRLSEDPAFFAEVVQAIYKPRSAESRPDPSPEQKHIAENGYRLLSTWRTVPGRDQEGRVDGERLKRWVAEAQELLARSDRKETGAIHIGQVLAYAPSEADEWPPRAVRELLEEIQDDKVESGLEMELFNQRGVTSRAPDAGGKPERELAARYATQAETYAAKWPRTAAMLRELARTWESHARREDEEAEQFRSGLER
jgi:hypothetical protein